MHLGEMKTLGIDEIIPYWRNPRLISDEQVEAVKLSIEKYGYQQPIVVDTENVIIVGHTRYTALRRMDVTEVPVIVAAELSANEVKQYRLIDNKAGEFSTWDFEKLTSEVEGIDEHLAAMFFPEIVGIDEGELEKQAHDQSVAEAWESVDDEVDFTCPSCFHSWTQVVTRADVLSGVVEGRETAE